MMAMAPGVHGFPYLIGSFENSTPRGAGLAETGEIFTRSFGACRVCRYAACTCMLPLRFLLRFDSWYSSSSTAEAVPRRLCSGTAARAYTCWILATHMG